MRPVYARATPRALTRTSARPWYARGHRWAFASEQRNVIRKRVPMTITMSVSLDVPNLAEGVAFYCGAFGLSKKSEPVPGVAVLHGLNIELCLLEKPPGSKPSPGTGDRRNFERHWTPVHLDFHVD